MSPGAPGRLAFLASAGAAVVVPLAYFPGLDAPFLAPKFSALELVAALGFLAWAWGRRLAWSRSIGLGVVLVLATTVLAWAAAPAAPYAFTALARWAALFGIAAGAALVAEDPAARQSLLEAIAAAAGAVSVVGLWQHLELPGLTIPVISAPGSTFGNRNLAAEAVALSLPLGAGAALGARSPRARLAIAASLALQLVYLAATRARGAWLGAGAGLLTLALLARPRLSRAAILGVAGAAAVALLAVLLRPPHNESFGSDPKRFGSAASVVGSSVDAQSVALRTRLGLWRRTLVMIGEHPLTGLGPGNWPVAFPRLAEPGATRDGVLSATLAPRQAHDDLLERTAETGVPGLLALLALLAGVVMAVHRRLASDRRSTAAAAGALVALLGAGVTGFPLEMPATLALAGLALGLLAPDEQRPTSGHARIPLLALAATLVVFAGVRAQGRVSRSHRLGQAERALNRDPGPAGAERALAALATARTRTPEDVRTELTGAQAALRVRRGPEATRWAEQALAREPSSPNAWAMLAAAKLASADPNGARDAAVRARTLLNDHPLALATEARAARLLGDRAAARVARDRLAALAANAAADRTTGIARQLLLELDAEERAAPGP